MDTLSIAVIGGGPGGLMTAYRLQQRAIQPSEITLFEAGPRLGGKIITRQFKHDPVLYEAGAAELYDYSQLGPDPLRELIVSLGLTTRPISGRTVVLGDRILKSENDVQREFGDAAWRALQQFKKKARTSISPAGYYEADWKDDNRDPLSRQTFRELLDRVPDDIARRYIEVAVHSDLATEPQHTNAMYGLSNYLMDEPDYMQLYTIEGGIERLPQELAKRLTAKVLLNEPVVRVERTPLEDYRVTSRRGGENVSEDFDFVVVALPHNWLSAIEWGGPALEKAMRAHIAHYDYPAHYLRVSALFKEPFWREQIDGSYFMLDAFGGCCVYDEGSRNHEKNFGALGWLLAGDAALTMSNFPDDVLIQQALDSLPRSLRHGAASYLEGRVFRFVGTVNGLPGGFPAKEPDSRHVPEPDGHPWLFVVGDYLFDSTVNGVLDSADVVAEWIEEEVMEFRASAPMVPAPTNGTAHHRDAPRPLKEAK